MCLCSGCNSTKVVIYIKFSIIPEKKNPIKKKTTTNQQTPNVSDSQRGMTQKWKLKVVLKMPDCIYTYQVSMCSCKVCVLFSAGAQVLIPCSLSSAQGSQGMCWFWLCWAIPGVKRRGHQLQASRDGERSHCSSFSDFLPCAFLLMAKKNTN